MALKEYCKDKICPLALFHGQIVNCVKTCILRVRFRDAEVCLLADYILTKTLLMKEQLDMISYNSAFDNGGYSYG